MITFKTEKAEFVLKPTIFPDKTSQLWKIPEEIIFGSSPFQVIWNFEEEREIVDIYSLYHLLGCSFINTTLHMPYLPYGRQDKPVGNNTTFNLRVLAQLINTLQFRAVTTIDAHNPEAFEYLFTNGKNIHPSGSHWQVQIDFRPTRLVFPDKGAMVRYNRKDLQHYNPIYCEKVRDQLTGNITGMTVRADHPITSGDRLLIIDDICDGGATFIGVAKELRKLVPEVKIGLFVTHGIFSRGRQHLLDNGIDEIYTTNSLLTNKEGYKV